MKKGIDYVGVTVSFLCHDGKGNVLLNKRSVNCRDEHGRWDGGGGGLEFGDTVEDTLRREIKEEYNADVQEFEFLGYRDVLRTQQDRQTHWLSLDFWVLVDRQQVKNNEPHKFDALEWFRLDDLPEPMHTQFPNFMSSYKSKLPVSR